jgi:hypothetical protein
MKSILFKNSFEEKSSWVNLNSCKFISIESIGIVVHFVDNTTYLVVSSHYIQVSGVGVRDVLFAIVDKIWGDSDDTVVDVDEIIDNLKIVGNAATVVNKVLERG